MLNNNKIATKKRILKTAFELFNKNGYNRVTIDDLVYDLGMSKRTFYEFFPSKEILLDKVIDDMQSDIKGHLDSVLNDKEGNFIARLNRLIEIMASHISTVNPQFLEDIRRQSPKASKKITDFRNERINIIIPSLVDEGLNLGILRTDINKEFLVQIYIIVTDNLFNPMTLAKLRLSAAQAEQYFIQMLLEGVLKEDVRQEIILLNKKR
jgi:AcrR family transcriptional regulator